MQHRVINLLRNTASNNRCKAVCEGVVRVRKRERTRNAVRVQSGATERATLARNVRCVLSWAQYGRECAVVRYVLGAQSEGLDAPNAVSQRDAFEHLAFACLHSRGGCCHNTLHVVIPRNRLTLAKCW